MLGHIIPGQRGFARARANSRPGGGATQVLGHISGQGRGLGQISGQDQGLPVASARANFRPKNRFCQGNNKVQARGGVLPGQGQIPGQGRGFARVRADSRCGKGFFQC